MSNNNSVQNEKNPHNRIMNALLITLSLFLLCIFFVQLEKQVKEHYDDSDNFTVAASGNEREDIGQFALTQVGNGNIYGSWYYNYTSSKEKDPHGYHAASTKTVAWCYIFITSCAGQSGCKLHNKGETIGWYQDGLCARAKSHYQSRGRYTDISTMGNVVTKGEAGDIIFYQNTNGSNHVDILVSTTGSSAVVVGGNLSSKVKRRDFTNSSKTLDWNMYFRGLAKPMYRATCTFYTNGGSISSMPNNWMKVSEGGSGSSKYYTYKFYDDMAYYEGTTTNMPTGSNVGKSGASFQGWFSSSGFSGSAVSSLPSKQRGNLTFYAKWSDGATIPPTVTTPPPTDVPPITTDEPVEEWFNVSLLPNGGSILSGNVTRYKKGVGATLPTASQMYRVGHDFTGWYDYYSSGRKYSISATDSGDKTFYATWKPKVYSVTLVTNGGTIASGHNVTSYTYGVGATLPTAAHITRRGHDFLGWYTTNSTSGTRVYSISTTDTGSKTYYAQWKPSVYSVKLHPNGGTILPGKDITQYTYGVGAVLPNPVDGIIREGFEFGGWYDNPGLSGTPVKQIGTDEIDAKEYWAKWISFNIESGTKIVNVYSLHNDTTHYKSDSFKFKMTTESTAKLDAYFTKTADPKSAKYTDWKLDPVTANKEYTQKPPKSACEQLCKSKDKKNLTIYLQIRATCTYNDGNKTYTYEVITTQPIILKFVAAYIEK